jgi:putative addiction module component (TIGR02574 family)
MGRRGSHGTDDAASLGDPSESADPSSQERGLLIDRLIESLDEGPAEEGVEEAWAHEIKRRVDEVRSGKVKMIPGEQVLRRLANKVR